MPKRNPTGRQPKFLRLRPLHAFTSAPADQARQHGRKLLWRSVGLAGGMALIGAIGRLLFRHH